MPSPGLKTAVSDYENLSTKYTYIRDVNDISNTRKDVPHKIVQTMMIKNKPFQNGTDINNSSNADSVAEIQELPYKDFLHDLRQVQRLENIPMPTAWSPSMSFEPNPALFLTPQKSSLIPDHLSKVFSVDTVLEPQDKSKVPQPMSWSPGMVIRPNPSLYVTPDKFCSKKYISNTERDENIIKCPVKLKESSGRQEILPRTKEKLSVRFDLPSTSSGDETTDHEADCYSPITLKGSDISIERCNSESPVWKHFSPQKTYNPNTYSDESSLDESMLSLLPGKSFGSDCRDKSVTSDLTNDDHNNHDILYSDISSSVKSSVSGTSLLSFPITSSLESNMPAITEQQQNGHRSIKEMASSVTSCKLKKSELPKIKSKPHKLKKDVGKYIVKAVPQCTKPSSSSYESVLPTPYVVREAKNDMVSTEYSYPFDTREIEDSEFEHAFARPEYNSTLKMRSELDNLCQQEIDVKKALEQALHRSEVRRMQLNEKAASYTNRVSDQFNNLVDLDTSVEKLCERVVRMRTSKAVPTRKREVQSKKKSDVSQKAPDLMEFFSSNFQKETPDLSLPGQKPVASQLLTVPSIMTFDLYRHNRAWQGIHDF